jgi:transposase InsO family protein
MSTSTGKDVSHIEKLNGNNFPFWKFQVLLIIEHRELLEIVLGTDTLPNEVKDNNDVVTNKKEIQEWKKRDIEARCILTATIEQQTLRTLVNCRSAHEMWARLTTQYEQNAQVNKHVVQQQFFEYSFEPGNDIMSHITAIETIANRLRDLGVTVDDTQIMTKILCTLPPSFRHVTTAWDNVPEKDKSITLLTAKLLKEEAMNKLYGGHEGGDSAFFARNTPKASSGGSWGERGAEKRRSSKCNFCGRRNHSESECWYKRRSQGATANVARKDEDDSGETVALTSFSMFAGMPQGNRWYADSGASDHMSDQRDDFFDFKPIKPGKWLVKGIGADSAPLNALGRGSIKVQLTANGKHTEAMVNQVLFVPNLGASLLSIATVTDNGLKVEFEGDKVEFLSRQRRILMTGTKIRKKLYLLNMKAIQPTSSQACVASSAKEESLSLWHQRLGHVNKHTIQEMAKKNLAVGLVIAKNGDSDSVCEGCVYGKQHRLPFPKAGRTRATKIGELVHSDVCGPMGTPSPSGSKYFVIFKDDFSGFRVVHFIKAKSEVFELFKNFVNRVENETGNRVVTLRSDNGGEYVSKEFNNYLQSQGIRHETSAPHCPEQNGVAERENRTLVESARTMIHFKGVAQELWAEATNCAAYILNRVATPATSNVTPFETWYGTKPNLSHIRVFGCVAYVHIPKQERNKFDKKSIKCILVGYSDTQKAYRLWDQEERKIRISRDVIFSESSTKGSLIDLVPDFTPTGATQSSVPTIDAAQQEEDAYESSENDRVEEATESSSAETELQKRTKKPLPPPREHPDRERRQPQRYGYHAAGTETRDSTPEPFADCDATDGDPATYEEAVNSTHAREWIAAMEDEHQSLLRNGTWELVDLPEGRSAVKCKWVFKTKRKSNDTIDRFKARLVAKGFTQRKGIDYEETFSPVVKHNSLRAILSVAAAEDMDVIQLDVKTAFLHGDLNEEIFMEQPEGFVCEGGEQKVCRLKKSIYGLKQASREWNSKFDHFLVQFGLNRCVADPCVYYQKDRDSLIILAIWVDDGLLCSRGNSKANEVTRYLNQQFEITIAQAECFVGIEISRDRSLRSIHLSQSHAVRRTLQEFNMSECKERGSPADKHAALSKNPDYEDKVIDPAKYREGVGRLMYLATSTRPDLAYAVNQVAQFSNNPGPSHWYALKRIFMYLKNTQHLGITYCKGAQNNVLVAYSDADFAGDVETRRSTSGFVLILNNGAISWFTRRQRCTSLSTTESEYVAASEATREIVWTRRLLQEIGFEQTSPTSLLCDNQGAVKLVKNPELHKRTKHVDVRYHFIREKEDEGEIVTSYVDSENQLADMFTKALDTTRFTKLRHEIGMEKLNG